jgi:hypothetical protein
MEVKHSPPQRKALSGKSAGQNDRPRRVMPLSRLPKNRQKFLSRISRAQKRSLGTWAALFAPKNRGQPSPGAFFAPKNSAHRRSAAFLASKIPTGMPFSAFLLPKNRPDDVGSLLGLRKKQANDVHTVYF